MIIFRSLDLSIFDHCMFWATCNLAYFGFLRSAEFTVSNLASFSPALHLSVCDILVDLDTNLSCLRVQIKASKTDPFRKVCFVHIGRGCSPLCALQAVLGYLAVRGNSGGPLLLCQDGRPLSCTLLHHSDQRNPGWGWGCSQFLQPQFSHWCGHHSSVQRHPRSPYSGLGPLV